MRALVIASVALGLISLADAGDGKATSKVEGTMVIPKEIAAFDGRVVEIRLYRHDPRIADKAADLVELLEFKDFAHVEGKETRKDFVIGAKSELDAKMGYYVTLFILDGGKRTHMGESETGKGPARVLTAGNPAKITLKVRAVGK